MSKMGEKVAYLKGLAEGLGVNAETEQGKLMLAMIDTLEAFAEQIEDNEEELEELKETLSPTKKKVKKARKKTEEELWDEEMLEEDGINCPNCGTPLEFDFDCCCDDCCDCEEESEE